MKWHRRKPDILSLIFVLSALLLPAADAQAADTLDELLLVYQQYELPFPPENARLSLVQFDGAGKTFGALAFIEEAADPNDKLWIWIGCERIRLTESMKWKPCQPSLENFAQSVPVDESEGEGFRTFPDVALAIQCKHRGWLELSEAVWKRAKSNFSKNRRDRAPIKPRHVQEALVFLAWDHWCNEFAISTSDRRPILEHLRQLNQDPFAAQIRGHSEIIADIAATLQLAPTSDGLEGEVNALIDFGICSSVKKNCPEKQFPDLATAAGFDAHYAKLEQAGLDAVPVLIKHLHDYRVTRCIDSSNGNNYSWHVRIADVVASLLNGLAGEELSFDFLAHEGRGMALDENHVNYWWSKLQKESPLEYLRNHAIVKNDDGDFEAREQILHALGAEYPDHFAVVFEQALKDVSDTEPLFNALEVSRLDAEAKSRLLLQAAHNATPENREIALRRLCGMNHPDAVPLLVAELQAIPNSPEGPYRRSTARIFAPIVCCTDDDRAWQALLETGKRVDVGQRLEILYSIGYLSDRKDQKVIDFLCAFLNDESVRVMVDGPSALDGDVRALPPPPPGSSDSPFSGRCAGFTFNSLAVCNYAALQLANKLELNVVDESDLTETDLADLDDRVRETLASKIQPSADSDAK
jgi:hypothetical protein